jgi:hypothetical protein
MRQRAACWRRAALAIAGGLSAAAVVRYGLVQSPEMGWACGRLEPPWWCIPRELLIGFFRWQGVGIAALVLALALLLGDMRRLAPATMALGAAGLILYAPETSAAGLLIALLLSLRD